MNCTNAQLANGQTRRIRLAGLGELVQLVELRERMQEAAYTLRRLPMPARGLPGEFRVAWPDVAYDWLAYPTSMRAPRIPPLPAEISRLDEALGWLHLLTREQRLVLFARAQGWAWNKIVALDEMEKHGRGRGKRQLQNILGDAEARILAEINGTPRRMVIEPRIARVPKKASAQIAQQI